MGVRKLGNRPWTFTDAFTNDELAFEVTTVRGHLQGSFLLQLMKRSWQVKQSLN